MRNTIFTACLVFGLPFTGAREANSLGQDTGIFRCPQADGTVAFQGMPCDESSDAASEETPRAATGPMTDGDPGDDEDRREFVNPYDQPDYAVPATRQDPSPERSEERAACEKSTRDAIDAIDFEMRKGFSEAEGEAYLAELLQLTQALRACKTL